MQLHFNHADAFSVVFDEGIIIPSYSSTYLWRFSELKKVHIKKKKFIFVKLFSFLISVFLEYFLFIQDLKFIQFIFFSVLNLVFLLTILMKNFSSYHFILVGAGDKHFETRIDKSQLVCVKQLIKLVKDKKKKEKASLSKLPHHTPHLHVS